MSLVITLGKEAYLPLRAVPIVTSGILNTPNLAEMISDPDAFCGVIYNPIISVFAYQNRGRPLPVDYQSFSLLRSKSRKESPLKSCRHLPAGMLVRRNAAREAFDLLVQEIAPTRPGMIKPAQTIWIEDPPLSADDFAFILEGLPHPRSNSAVELRARMLELLEDVEQQVAREGITFDRSAMPGTKRAWSELLGRLDPTVVRSPATHEEHFRAMGLRWRAGSRPEQLDRIRAAMGIAI